MLHDPKEQLTTSDCVAFRMRPGAQLPQLILFSSHVPRFRWTESLVYMSYMLDLVWILLSIPARLMSSGQVFGIGAESFTGICYGLAWMGLGIALWRQRPWARSTLIVVSMLRIVWVGLHGLVSTALIVQGAVNHGTLLKGAGVIALTCGLVALPSLLIFLLLSLPSVKHEFVKR